MTRRLLAALSLCLFMQTAALTPWLHACCMDVGAASAHAGHGGGGDGGTAHGDARAAAAFATPTHGGHGGGGHAHVPADGVHTASAGDDHTGAPHHHGATLGETDDDSGSSGVCCCGACECCLTAPGVLGAAAAGPVRSAVVRHDLPRGLPSDADVKAPDFLLPYPNGPPETRLHLV
jgi:hypothetical protein